MITHQKEPVMTVLFAQSVPSGPSAFVVLLILVPILAFVVMVVWLVIKAVKHDRDLTHQERLPANHKRMMVFRLGLIERGQ